MSMKTIKETVQACRELVRQAQRLNGAASAVFGEATEMVDVVEVVMRCFDHVEEVAETYCDSNDD